MKIKQAKTDFTRNDLPKNRWEVLGDCLKVRFLLFLSMGLTLLLFSIPLFFVTVLNDYSASSLYHGFVNAEYTKEEYLALTQSANSLYSLFYIPCYVILAVGLAGVMQVIRQLVWGEGVFFMQDILDGIRSSGLYDALIAFFMGLVAFLINTFLSSADNSFWIVIPVIVTLVFCPPAGFMMSQIVVYKNPFFRYLRNGFLLYIKTVPTTLLFLALFLLPAVLGLNLIPFPVKYAVLLVLSLLPAPILLAGWFLYSCSVFDRLINKEWYPEIYDKGVYRKAE